MMQRYSIYTSLVESVGFEVKPQSDGNYVKYEDAMHRIKELEAQNEFLKVGADVIKNQEEKIKRLENKLAKSKQFSEFQGQVVGNADLEIEQKDKRIKEFEQETERLRNCLHHVLEENKRGYHLTGTDELTNSLAKRDLEQQAKGVHSLFIQCQSDALVETWEISEYAEQLRKKAEGLK